MMKRYSLAEHILEDSGESRMDNTAFGQWQLDQLETLWNTCDWFIQSAATASETQVQLSSFVWLSGCHACHPLS